MRKQIIPTFAMIVLLTIFFGGCKPEPVLVPKHLTLWHTYQIGSSEEMILTTLIENAQKTHPDWIIDVEQVPFDKINSKYQTEVTAGGGPDLYIDRNDNLGELVRAGLVADITDLVKGKLDKITEQGLEGMSINGKVFGIPESGETVALYYNKDLIQDPPETTDDLLTTLENGSKMTMFIGAYHLFGWPGAFGGELMDVDGKCVADEGGWIEAANYLLALKDAGAQFSTDFGASEAPFKSGETAFWINGSWALKEYKESLGDRLGVIPLPSGSKPSSPLIGIDGYYVNPNSKNKEAAVELGLFLTSKGSEKLFMDMAGHIPVRTDISISNADIQGFVAADSTANVRPQSLEFSNSWVVFDDMWLKIFEGTTDPEAAISEACAAMNAMINK